jgi:hypothetical protein
MSAKCPSVTPVGTVPVEGKSWEPWPLASVYLDVCQWIEVRR